MELTNALSRADTCPTVLCHQLILLATALHFAYRILAAVLVTAVGTAITIVVETIITDFWTYRRFHLTCDNKKGPSHTINVAITGNIAMIIDAVR